MSLRHSYTLLAPVYDRLVARATRAARARSLARLAGFDGALLVPGIGTGLDIPQLPPAATTTAIDLTPAMLDRARARAARAGVSIDCRLGDAMALPFAAAQFDAVLLHLILAVVPAPARALAEARRVLRPGGRLLILDKFLPAGRPAPLRRLLNPLASRLATRTDVVFEPLLAAEPALALVEDRPAAVGGWFRQIELQRR